MNPFDYICPSSLDDAIALGSAPGSAYLAGGTNLLDLMKVGISRPNRLVDISRLPGLDRIERLEDGSLRLGALATNSDVARHPDVIARFPSVSEALLSGASMQLRNVATIAGNLLQTVRCAWFFDISAPCHRRLPGSGCGAQGGEGREHAVLGWDESCIAVHPSDFCVAAAAMDAVVEITGIDGRREVALSQFHHLPKDGVVALRPGELVTGLRLPAASAGFAANSRYLKVRERTSYAFALVSSAAALNMRDGLVAEARVVLGGVAARPWRSQAAEAVLAGQRPDRALFEQAAEAALSGARASADNAFKITLAGKTVIRALEMALAGTPARSPALPGSVFAPVEGSSSHV